MFDSDFVKNFKEKIQKAHDKAVPTAPPYAWVDTVVAAIDDYYYAPSLHGLVRICKRMDKIPASDQEQCEKALGILALALELEEKAIKAKEMLERLAEERLQKNLFEVGRDLNSYKGFLGGPFSTALSEMSDSSRWLDGGAGEAKAMIEYLDSGGKGLCTAACYEIPGGAAAAIAKATSTYKDRFYYASGKYFSNMSNSDLRAGPKEFDLITDLNGVLYYTETLVEDLTRYLDLLKVGGVLIFVQVHVEINMKNAVSNTGRAVPDIARWANNISGVILRYHVKGGFIEMRRVADEIVVPDLTLNLYEPKINDNDPIRRYTCVHSLPDMVIIED
jgi:SAM-dependent methyltransferase